MPDTGFRTVLFHALFRESSRPEVRHPYLYVSTDDFENCLDMFENAGFAFVDPSDPGAGLSGFRNILITFDDGYYNNLLALDILGRHGIRALFFMVRDHILHRKLFWWDAYLRKRMPAVTFEEAYEEIQQLKAYPVGQIESRMKAMFSPDCFEPAGDVDRPMTLEELRLFAGEKSVSLGVHSKSHEILTHLDKEGAVAEISEAKLFLEEHTGQQLDWLSYPNGNVGPETIGAARDLGFKWALTTVPGLNYSEDLVSDDRRLSLYRHTFPIPRDPRPVVEQVRSFVSEVAGPQ